MLWLLGSQCVSRCALGADDVDRVISQYESARSGLRSFHVKMDILAPKPPNSVVDKVKWFAGAGRTLVPFFRIEWITEGSREKFTFIPLAQTTDRNGLPANILETILVDGHEYVLTNWDRENPQEISPSVQGSVKAHVRLRSSKFAFRDPSQKLLLNPRFQLDEPRFGLREYVGRFANCSITSEDDSQLTLQMSGDSHGIIADSEHIEMQISKSKSFLISRLSRVNGKETATSGMGEGWTKMEFKVNSFHDLGDGTYLPQEIVYSIFDAFNDDSIVLSRCTVEVVSANEPIPSDTFEMVFPEHVVVVDQASAPGEVPKWVLWGKGNRPRQAVSGQQELERLDLEPANRKAARSRMWTVVWIANICFIAALVVVFFKKWRKK